jgi:alkanesulfonate monooxygenase
MKREIRLNAFAMNCVGHQSSGMWRHPRDSSATYTDLDYWTSLGRTLERGLFDGLFLADVLGVYDVYGGNADAALRTATQIPVNDPMLVVPAIAQVTEHLGFGVTVALTFEQPYVFARRMSTLDHLTRGRIAWNIVTGYLESAAKGVGQSGQSAHDLRYDMADDFMEVVYRLWEGSWEDDAVVRDAARGVFTRPEKVHRVRYQGPHYGVDAIHLCEPSPQRTPVLYQAGASPRGRDFAARHAECVFTAAQTARQLAPTVADLRGRTARFGRAPDDLLIFTLVTLIPGRTEAEARDRHAEYLRYASEEGALTLVSGWMGIDLSAYDPDEPLRDLKSEAIHSVLSSLTRADPDPDKVWTLRKIAEFGTIGGLSPVIVGDPGQIADALEDWVRTADVDGFNLAYAVMPETYEAIVDLVVPELQARGIYKTAYAPGTLREKYRAGAGPRLPESHPAAAQRVRPRG